MLVIPVARLAIKGYARPTPATLLATCTILKNEISEESMDVTTRASTKAENVP
jgi:hypothetical protein